MATRKKKETTLEEIALNYKNGIYGRGLEARQNLKRYGYNLLMIERIARTVKETDTKQNKKSSKK